MIAARSGSPSTSVDVVPSFAGNPSASPNPVASARPTNVIGMIRRPTPPPRPRDAPSTMTPTIAPGTPSANAHGAHTAGPSAPINAEPYAAAIIAVDSTIAAMAIDLVGPSRV